MKKFIQSAVLFTSTVLLSFLIVEKSTYAYSKYFLSKGTLYDVSGGTVLSDNSSESGDTNKDSNLESSRETTKKSSETLKNDIKKVEIKKNVWVEREVEDELNKEIEVESDGSHASGKVSLEIKKRTSLGRVELKIREDGRVEMKIKSTDPNETEGLENDIFESTGSDKDIVSILSGSKKDKVQIKTSDGKIKIESSINSANTKFPVSIDPETNTLVITTPSGNVNLVTLPDAAIKNLLSLKKIGVVTSAELGTPSNDAKDKLSYHVEGLKTVKLFGTIPLEANVSVEYGAESSEVLSESNPWYLNLFGFLFTQ